MNTNNIGLHGLQNDARDRFNTKIEGAYDFAKLLKTKPNKKKIHRNANRWLAQQLNVPTITFHTFNENICVKIIDICENRIQFEDCEEWLIK